MKKIVQSKAGLKFFYFMVILFIGCQGTAPKPKLESNSHSIPLVITNVKSFNDNIPIKDPNLNLYFNKIDSIEKKIMLIENQLNVNSLLIDSNKVNNDAIHQFNNQYKGTIDKFQNGIMEQDYFNVLNRVQKKIQILEDRTFYTDSLYFEIMTDMVMIENKISSLLLSFQEMNEISFNKSKKILPKISDEEYSTKYIEALAHYQNGEWDISLDEFNFLIQVDNDHDLADNCQYWIGEVYYALNNYNRSIREFEKVSSFQGTNKSDDAQFKIGLCYMNIGQIDKAMNEFKKLLEYYPNSEYYSRSQDYINQY